MEVDGAGFFRIRSYRHAAQAIESPAAADQPDRRPKKAARHSRNRQRHAANLQEMISEGKSRAACRVAAAIPSLHVAAAEDPGSGSQDDRADLGRLSKSATSMGARLAREGKIRKLPRMGEKHEQKLIKASRITAASPGAFRSTMPNLGREKLITSPRSRVSTDHPGGFSAARTRNGGRPRHPGHRQSCCDDDGQRAEVIEHVLNSRR